MTRKSIRGLIRYVIKKSGGNKLLESRGRRISSERRLVRGLSRLSRAESLDLAAVDKLKKEGVRFATFWGRYRRLPSLVHESRLMKHLKNLVGADLALSFFVRSESLIPQCLATEFPDFIEADLFDLPEQNLVEVFDFRAPDSQDNRLLGLDSSGTRWVDVKIRMRGKDALYRLDDVTVFGGSGIIRKESHAIWPNYIFENSGDGVYPWDSVLVEHVSGRAILRKGFLEPPFLAFDAALSLLDSSARHFGHFAWGLVPRLRVLFQGYIIPTGLKVLVGDETPSSVIDFFELWGLKDLLVIVPKGMPVKVKNLYMPTQLKYFPDILPATAKVQPQSLALAAPEFNFLFSLRSRDSRPQSGRVSLLRPGSGEGPSRKCLNQYEVESTLSKVGVESLTNKLHDTFELCRDLRGARLIVVDDGSISANVLLAGVTGATIIYLTHPGISGGSHLEWWTQGYLAYIGNEVVSMHVNVQSMDRTSDWWVDCDRLQELIAQYGPTN